jgi:hypothetical protein
LRRDASRVLAFREQRRIIDDQPRAVAADHAVGFDEQDLLKMRRVMRCWR